MKLLLALLVCLCPALVLAQSLSPPPKPLPPPPILQDPILSQYLYDEHQQLERLRQRLADTERRLELVEKILADQMQGDIDRLTIAPRRQAPH